VVPEGSVNDREVGITESGTPGGFGGGLEVAWLTNNGNPEVTVLDGPWIEMAAE
jgi:hypothetical protein